MRTKLWFAAWLVGLCLIAAGARAQSTTLQGRYSELSPPRPVATGARIEVIEFFYYGCPVCYELQPHLSRWLIKAPDYVAIRRVPAVSSEGWEPFARLFYTLEAMGHLPRLHWPVYDNFHFDGVQLNQVKPLLEWVARNGIDANEFLRIYESEETTRKVGEARAMLRAYDVRSVPTFVVDGRYVSSARVAGGTRQLMEVVDQLVRQARKERP